MSRTEDRYEDEKVEARLASYQLTPGYSPFVCLLTIEGHDRSYGSLYASESIVCEEFVEFAATAAAEWGEGNPETNAFVKELAGSTFHLPIHFDIESGEVVALKTRFLGFQPVRVDGGDIFNNGRSIKCPLFAASNQEQAIYAAAFVSAHKEFASSLFHSRRLSTAEIWAGASFDRTALGIAHGYRYSGEAFGTFLDQIKKNVSGQREIVNGYLCDRERQNAAARLAALIAAKNFVGDGW